METKDRFNKMFKRIQNRVKKIDKEIKGIEPYTYAVQSAKHRLLQDLYFEKEILNKILYVNR